VGILVLSTLERLRRAANKTGTVSSDDDALLSALAAASQAMQSYCSMQWHRSPQVETRACAPSGIIMLRAWPVVSISSVQILTRGSLNPRTLQPSEYALFDDNELHYTPGLGSLDRVITSYIGGIAESTATSTENITAYTGTPVAGNSFSSPTARGVIQSIDTTAMTARVTVSDGTLFPGDTLTSTTTGSVWTVTLGETIIPSIISDYCDLANACDQQAVYIYQRRNTPGRKVVQSGQGSTTFEDSYKLLPGVIEILEYYDHQYLG